MFTQFDIIVSFIIFLFSTFGLLKGAIKSILGLGKWYGAGVLTLLFYPQARDIVTGYIQPGMIANGVAVFLTYIAALVVLSILIGIFVAALGGTVGGPGDRLLGAVVGITIGFIIASTMHYFIRSLGAGADPSWLKKGATYSFTSRGADKLQDYFKDVVHKMGSDFGLAKSIDPTGEISNKIKQFQTSTGSQVDFEKLKEAIRMMKEEGMKPSQIKDMINIQDYMAMPSADNMVNDAVSKIKKIQGSGITKPQAPVAIDDQE